MNNKSSNLKQPVAPPVYRPQPLPRVLQKKSVVTGPRLPPTSQSSHVASIHRPQPTPKVLKRTNAVNPKQIAAKPALRHPQTAPAAATAKTRARSPVTRPGGVSAPARGRVPARGSVIQGLIVRMSKGHGLPLTSRDALSQAEVQDAVNYLESRNHGPTVDFFTEPGPYKWATGDWKGGARNYIVSHADAQHGLGIPAGELAEALKARGLASGMQLKLIACSMASKISSNGSQAEQLKNALKALGIVVDITAAPYYVTYSTKGKLLHSNIATSEDTDPNDPSPEEFNAYNKFVEDATEIVTTYFQKHKDFNDEQFVMHPHLSELTHLMKARGISLSNFQKIKDARTTRQANDALMAAMRSEAKKKPQDKWMTVLTKVISLLGAEASQSFQALQKNLYLFSLQHRPAKVEQFFDSWKKSPNTAKDAFKVDSNHPRRAPRTDTAAEWKKF
jgi:hypothetical protein